MIGNECPECGKRLEGQTCSCGWRGGAISKLMRECTKCEKQRPVETPGMPGTYPCEHCGALRGTVRASGRGLRQKRGQKTPSLIY